MAGALDFLFEGRPPPSTTTYGTTTSDLPKWLSDYTQGLIGRANAIAGEEYQPYGGPRLAGLTPDQERSFAITRQASGNYNPLMQGATEAAQGALTQAAPYLASAGRTFPGAVGEYMDPYIENVINRNTTLTNRALNERFLPSVAQYFGAAGSGPRSTEMRAEVDRGVRDLTEGLNEQNLAALSGAYGQAGQLFGQDAARMGALAQTAGNLGLNSATVQGALAETGQNLALRDAAAQAAVGETLQQDEQRSLDLMYQDFLNQRDYPRGQVDWLSNIIRGTPHGTTSTVDQTGPADVYQPSGASQLGSLATTAAGIWDLIKGFKKPTGAAGGALRLYGSGYARRRRPAYMHGGALRYAHG
jgi:hypothetical protein